jgi:ribosomal protein L14E/L6E/L27E
MDIVKANIVKSTAGRDKGEIFFVLATEGDFLLLADGKLRPVERPKRKRRKHVVLRRADGGELSRRIRSNESITNSELRKAIAAVRGGDQDQEG